MPQDDSYPWHFKGQAVVVAWFPKAFTPGCTAEGESFRDDGAALDQLKAAYFMASCDSQAKNQKFAKALGSSTLILSDETGATARAFGVVDAEREIPYRWTFYIGPDGKIVHIDKKVKPATHAKDVAEKLKELGLTQVNRKVTAGRGH